MDADEKQLLEQILKWTREGALPAVLERIGPLLDTEAKKRTYHAIVDGGRTPRTIEEVASVSRDTAQKLIDEWRGAGMIVPGSDPPKAAFSLVELGIQTPALKVPKPKKTAKK